MKKQSMVTLANENVSIVVACGILGIEVQEGQIRSQKLRCPFGDLYHSDEGRDRTFKVYPDTNSAFCFRCNMSFTPVKLIALAWGLSSQQAAAELLERVGHKPQSLAQAWDRASPSAPVPDADALSQALFVYCARLIPDWESRQFEKNVTDTIDACLLLLQKVTTEKDAMLWLNQTKKIMHKMLRGY